MLGAVVDAVVSAGFEAIATLDSHRDWLCVQGHILLVDRIETIGRTLVFDSLGEHSLEVLCCRPA